MFDPAQLAALAAIHRRGSFEAAAHALGVTPSAISQRIKALEDRVGALVIQRASPCSATAVGLRLIRHHEAVAALEAAVLSDLHLKGEGPITLRIAVNADSLATWVIPALAEVTGVLFDLVIDDQAHSQDWLKRGEVLGAVTSHPGPLQGCETRPLGVLRYLATASPAFVAKHWPNGVLPEGFAMAPSLRFSQKDELQDEWFQQTFGHSCTFPQHRLASAQGFVDAAVAGLGWGMNPLLLIKGALADGQLQELVKGAVLDVPLYWQFSRQAAPVLADLTRALQVQAARHLVQGALGPSSK